MRLKSALRRGVAAAVIAGIVVSSGIPAYAARWDIANGDITVKAGDTEGTNKVTQGETIDKVLGLELGADDYIVKPFSPREVVSRIKAVLRRTCAAPDTAQDEKLTTLTYGSLEIQPERYSVKLAGQSVACTPREVELLYLLASHPGRVFDREQILSRIWGYDFFGDTRTVDTHIKRLRQKLTCEEMGQKWDIITVYGVGYKFEAET